MILFIFYVLSKCLRKVCLDKHIKSIADSAIKDMAPKMLWQVLPITGNNFILLVFVLLIDIDECTMGRHDCHGKASCTNIHGAFYCTCNRGYTGNGKSCSGKYGNSFHIFPLLLILFLFLILFSFMHAAYPLNISFFLDINECSTNNGGCDANAECTNFPGSHSCKCKTGFNGNGTTCTG